MAQEDKENNLAYQAAKAGVEYAMQKHPAAIGGDNFTDEIGLTNIHETFEDGAEFGYKFAIKKACQWLWGVRLDYYAEHDEEFLNDFLKAMQL